MNTYFSFHAFKRVNNRLSMTHQELKTLLDNDLTINIGKENNSNREHKLFYSVKDEMCFVAIQDTKTGTVITILPIDYHENISWSVSIDAQNLAKNLIVKETKMVSYKISGIVVDDYEHYKKTINLGSWRSLYDLDLLIKDTNFIDFLISKIKEKTDLLSKVHKIWIRKNKNDEPFEFSILNNSMLIESN